MKHIWLLFKNMMNGDIFSRITFLLTCFSVIIFTIFIIGSFLICEKPEFDNHGNIIPIVYSKTIIYFPCSGEDFARSLAEYTEKNNLQICGMASKNTLWTKGYIVAIKEKTICVLENPSQVNITLDGKLLKIDKK
jgi:hypothetical protein